jgi:hypothetical protein
MISCASIDDYVSVTAFAAPLCARRVSQPRLAQYIHEGRLMKDARVLSPCSSDSRWTKSRGYS